MSQHMRHFLLVYDHNAGRLIKQEDFGEDGAAATRAYSAAEDEAREKRHLEIVLVGADSIETIWETHASYFDGTATQSKYLVGT